MFPTDEQLKEAFERYHSKPVPARVFGEWVGISRDRALRALRGHAWQHVPRPEGFQYMPARTRISPTRKLTPEHVAEGLRLYVENNWEPKHLGEFLGVKSKSAYGILRGQYFKEVPRPEGAVFRYAKRQLRDRVPELLQLALDNDWTPTQLAKYAECGWTTASNLLKGRTYPNVPTPFKTETPDFPKPRSKPRPAKR
jgi:hypothetical protein